MRTRTVEQAWDAGSPPSAGLRIVDVEKRYQRGDEVVAAVSGVSLAVAPGEFVALTGRSGSGKSSLLYLAGGLVDADGGEVIIAGASLSTLSPDERARLRRRQLGFVFQFFHLVPTLSVEENIALPLLFDGQRRADVDRRVDEMLGRVELSHRRSHLPGALSGGEMQRVAIARALANHPAVVLADEPTGNLDSETGNAVMALLVAQARLERAAVLMVTHDPALAQRADREVVMVDGRLR